MDRVRFGRALGFGTRQAIKSLVSAVDAATSDNPAAGTGAAGRPSMPSRGYSSNTTAPSQTSPRAAGVLPNSKVPAGKVMPPAARTASPLQSSSPKVNQRSGAGHKRLGQAIWEPFVRLSGVLWLEVTGVFFGLFALVALGFLWKLRGAWRPGVSADAASRHSLVGAAIMFALFGYFCVSSFIRAHRRERRR